MARNFQGLMTTDNGQVAFATSSAVYHGKGTFGRNMLVDEALKASLCDYEVEKRPIIAVTPELLDMLNNNVFIESSNILDLLAEGNPMNKWKCTMRTDTNTPFGIVGDGYGIVQNSKAFAFVDKLTSGQMTDRDHTPVIETCGALGNGETVFVTAKFPHQIRLDNKEANNIDMYIVFKTSHDGTGSIRICVSPVRVCCQNTLNWAMKKAVANISLRHTLNINARLDSLFDEENDKFAYSALNLMEVYEKSLKEDLTALRQKEVSRKQIEEMLARLCFEGNNLKIWDKTHNFEHEEISTRAKNLFTNMAESIESGVGQEYAVRGSAEWVLQGVTSYFQNHKAFKDAESKSESIIDGYASKKVQTAHDYLIAL